MMNYKALLRRLRVSVAFIATLFAVSALATSQTESVIYNFPSVEQSQLTVCGPHGNLVADAAGNFYGTDAGCDPVPATVYEIVRPAPPSKQWNRKVLYTFTGGATGGDPMTGLTFDNAGDLYGTANSGGAFGLGVVFQLIHPATPNGQWTEIVIHSFAGPPNDGSSPGQTGVVFDKSGNLYGATPLGGITIAENPLCGDGLYYATTSCGVVFQMTSPPTAGGEWGEAVIHYFDYTQGAFPVGTPIFDAQGNLYGATYGGGPHRGGSVYRLNHPVAATDPWKFRVLYTFPNDFGTDMSYPAGSLTLHGTG